jgi:uncharacterized protein with von Willebrand factor type A (vWA) domain
MTPAGTGGIGGPAHVPAPAHAPRAAAATGRFDAPYDALATLPRPVWLPVLTCSAGNTSARLRDTATWLTALDAGQLPPAGADFGDAEASAPLRAVVAELGLPALAAGVPALAEQVLRTLLWHLDRLADLQPVLSRAQAIADSAARFRSAWRAETAGLDEELQLLRDLVDGTHLRWDRLAGQLRTREWQAARQAAHRLAALPALAALLDRLGRAVPRTVPPRRAAQPSPGRGPLPRAEVATQIPGAPGELTGVRWSAAIAHMLPSEAVLLHHPLGRRLWRARHAEGRLLAHDTRAVLHDGRPDPLAPPRGPSAPTPLQPLGRGPLVLCLDTSGSMRGAPEQIAKAVVIPALRAAHAAGRGCHVIAFGGSGELLEHRLGGPGGLDALLALMGQAFDGGTDVQAPIERAIARVHEAGWQGADIVVVSDGEFGCVEATLAQADAARAALALQIHGVLVGDRETLGLLDLCDEIHWVRDWRRHGEGGTDAAASHAALATPVHSRSLTALYFPNALSARAARHRPTRST